MTANRKAELQRKLALAPVPKPPTNLADRIKSEIPKHLMVDTEKERTRLRQSVAFNVRVAASIILLVSSVYLALHLLSRRFGPPDMATTAVNNAAEDNKPIVMPATPPAAPAETTRDENKQKIVVADARQEPLVAHASAARKKNEVAGGRVQAEETGAAGAAGAAGAVKDQQEAQPALSQPTVVAEAPAVRAETDD